MNLNTKTYHNEGIPELASLITGWHYDRNLIDGATDNSQFVKLLEEVVELYCTLNKGKDGSDVLTDLEDMLLEIHNKGRIKPEPLASEKTPADDIGDINVVLINIAERNGLTFEDCLNTAWNDIKDRKGKMIDGVFVKEADLPVEAYEDDCV